MAQTRDLGRVVADTGECTAHAAMAAEVDRWHDRIPAETAALWDWLLRQDTDTLLDMLATFAAATLDAMRGNAYDGTLGHVDQLAAALDLDMAECWQPSARFMGRLSKAVMAAAVTEAGHPAVAAGTASPEGCCRQRQRAGGPVGGWCSRTHRGGRLGGSPPLPRPAQ